MYTFHYMYDMIQYSSNIRDFRIGSLSSIQYAPHERNHNRVNSQTEYRCNYNKWRMDDIWWLGCGSLTLFQWEMRINAIGNVCVEISLDLFPVELRRHHAGNGTDMNYAR